MPALVTHRLFGDESLLRLPHGIISTNTEVSAFLLGNQGPDPFFFRVRSPRFANAMALGGLMHRSRMTRAFAALWDGVAHLPANDAGVGRAFALGMLGHYVLDRNAHPFVYAQQWGIQEQDPSLSDAGSQVHAVIESDLDLFMLQRKRDGGTVEQFPPVEELVTNARIDRTAGALTSFVARSVYGVDLPSSEYGGAVRDMQLAYSLIEPAGSTSAALLGRAEGLLGRYSLLGALGHRVTDEVPSGAANLAHLPWKSPFSDETSTEDFAQVFDRALDDYEQAAERFIAGRDFAGVTGHVNYSGRVLGPDEECTERD